ncbi:nuclear transport factor 2 family protein [Spongiactinospora rosea]|nr:nuclear transport factor 2 family protein [Spongiactinospora rosea]
MSDDVDTAGTLKQLTKRVAELEAVRDLTSLRAEFHRTLNNQEWDALAALFTDEAHLDYGEYGQAHGSTEVRDYYSRLLEQIRDMRNASAISLKNFVHGHQVRVLDGETATGVCFFEEQIRFNKDSMAFSSIGQFSDEYVRRGDRWYFARVVLDHYWVVPDNDGWHWPW